MESHVSNVSEQLIYRLIGWLSVFFGAFILLLVLIPNPLIGRMCFVFCGGTITIVGVVLLSVGKRQQHRIAAEIHLTAKNAKFAENSE